MIDYDFARLAPDEFEALVRDLLQEELKIRIENFRSGADGGIDLRFAPAEQGVIVQCKRYERSAHARLKNVLTTEELPKLHRIKPKRYLVATSVGLSPQDKDSIATAMSPYVQTSSDILGRDNLNNLLGQHPAVERRHPKLWLTSTNVLSLLLHSGLWARSQVDEAEALRMASRFVVNPSVDRALDALLAHHYCIISALCPSRPPPRKCKALRSRYSIARWPT